MPPKNDTPAADLPAPREGFVWLEHPDVTEPWPAPENAVEFWRKQGWKRVTGAPKPDTT